MTKLVSTNLGSLSTGLASESYSCIIANLICECGPCEVISFSWSCMIEMFTPPFVLVLIKMTVPVEHMPKSEFRILSCEYLSQFILQT